MRELPTEAISVTNLEENHDNSVSHRACESQVGNNKRADVDRRDRVRGERGRAVELANPAITMIVPFAVGGPTDFIARIIGENMCAPSGSRSWSRTSPASAAGTTRAKQATPDGYTIAMGHMGTHGAAPALYPNLRYDPAKDFKSIRLAAGTPILIVTKKDFPATSPWTVTHDEGTLLL